MSTKSDEGVASGSTISSGTEEKERRIRPEDEIIGGSIPILVFVY